jgi:hypothetical protein
LRPWPGERWLNPVDFESIRKASTWRPNGLPTCAITKWTFNHTLFHDQFFAGIIQSSESHPRNIEQSARHHLATNIVCSQDKA